MKMPVEVIVAIIGFLGILITAWVGYSKTEMEIAARKQAEQELCLQKAALDFSEFMFEWSDISQELNGLMRDTCIDRFLIMRAWNGRLDPKWTTAVFQYRQGNQKPVSYVHFELDSDYVNRLKSIYVGEPLKFKTDDLQKCSIKDIYVAEGVTASVWMHLETKDMPRTQCAAITYCSFSTHEGDIDDVTITKCKILTDRLKGMASFFSDDSTTILMPAKRRFV